MTHPRWVLLIALVVGACTSAPPQKDPAPLARQQPQQPDQPLLAEHDPKMADANGVVATDLILFEDKESELVGFKHSESGKIILPAKYHFSYGFEASSGLAAVVEEGRWHYINVTGAYVYEPYIYDNGPDYPSDGLSRIIDENDKVGYIDAKGAMVISPQFDWASPFEEGVAQFCEGCKEELIHDDEHTQIVGGKWGTITKDGTRTYKKEEATP